MRNAKRIVPRAQSPPHTRLFGARLSEDQQALEAAFEQVEWEEIGRGVHEKYYELAQRLAKG